MMDPIPSALKDRMEVIDIPGYIEEEKAAIARDYLIPKQLIEHGLTKDLLLFTDAAVTELIRNYTREAGVRGLERKIARICRKVAKLVALKDKRKHVVTPENLEGYLGPVEFFSDLAERVDIPGVAVGLAWTATGGDILFIEASKMKGKKIFKITGQLGEVMRESAEAALTYLRANAEQLGIDPDVFETSDIHVHVPAGGIPKDGPSAGVTLLTALTSLMSGRLVRSDLAMTGEITLRGKVLPVGGIKEKVLAARRVGIQEVILPARNEKDLVDIPAPLREGMIFHFVENVGEVLKLALIERTGLESGASPEAAAMASTPEAAAPSA
jgi:ATP-dependent Lon protease